MNDVLKSLTALDIGGGTISSISYQTQTPVEQQLEELSLHLSKGGFDSLTELLQQTIGASVLITTDDDQKVVGKVLGLDEVEQPDEQNKERVKTVKRLNLLVDGCSIRSFPVLSLRNFVFRDPALRQDLQHLLNIMLDMKKKNLKKVTLFSKGSGKRLISASYVIESSVWKTSYRLKISEDLKKKPHKLEGWCLVDNTGDEDWSGVNLTLVGGRPNAFKLDLYTPRNAKRPTIAVQDEPLPNAPILKDVLPYHGESFLKDCPSTLSSLDVGGPKIGRVKEEKQDTAESRAISSWKEDSSKPKSKQKMDDLKQVKPVDVFQYEIEKPVSVKRGQSALVPFLSAVFEGSPCALFNHGLNNNHPMSVILFKNTFGITLDSGPMTIFDDDKCIGEAMVDSIPHGDAKFVAYGVERQITVKIESKEELQPYHHSELSSSQLKLTRYRRYIRTYSFNHTGSIDIEGLFLEHPFRKGKDFSLVATPLPVSKTENFYRFYLQAKAGQITTYTVQEQKLEHDYQSLYSIGSGTANTWLGANYIDRKTFNIIVDELIPLQEKIEKERKIIERDQNELNAAVNSQRNDYQTVYGRTSSSYTKTVDRDLMTRVKTMIAQEEVIRKLRVALNDKNLVQKQDQANLNAKQATLHYAGEIPLAKKDTSSLEMKGKP
eukprot:TRINITY_DN2928_c0_g1_i2.p1 TRINITY_DN2928_c0_g1~~TRINITY_DN2928_c0_g1_i2.p1  ORF type:complete len:734 (-),score=126.56 TRINITY_DN2928_c0_g1_i2:170-2152(-)